MTRHRSRVAAVLAGSGAVALAVGAALCAVGSMTSPTSTTAGLAAPRDAGGLPAATATPRGADGDSSGPAAGPAAPPVDLRTTGGPKVQVVPVAAAPDGTLTPPADRHQVGWWTLGAAAGAPRGTLLIAGHVDTPGGHPGAFGALSGLKMGAMVSVTGADGRSRTYRITARRSYDRQRLPADLFSRSGPHRLALVTCGGAYDRKAGGYQQNLVLYGTLVGVNVKVTGHPRA